MMWWMCLCAAAWLTDFGWQTNDRGEVEYIVQIEPDLLEDLRRGEEIVSEIPPELTNVRRVRIRVGTGALPRGNADAAAAKAPASPLAGLPAPPPSNSDPDPRSAGDTNEMEPPPLLPRGGAFEPPPAGPTGSDSRGGTFEPPAAAPDNSESRGGTFPIERNDATKLQPIPRSPGAKSLTERLSEKLGTSSPESPMRPASHVEPTSPVGNSSSPSRFGNLPKPGTEPSEKESHAAPIRGIEKKASPATERKEVTDDASRRRSVAVSPARRSKSQAATASSETSRPWGTLFVTSVLLFASIGLNIYLGWVTFGAVQRYRELARESVPA